MRNGRTALRHAGTPAVGGAVAGRVLPGRLILRRSSPRTVAEGLVLGSLFGLAAVAVKIPLVASSGGDLGYVLYVAAIGLASWFRGLSGGVAATVLTGFLNTFVFMHPGRLLPLETAEQVRFVIYLISGVVVAALFQSLRVERDLLAGALDEQARLARAIADRDQRLELVLAASRTGIWEYDLLTRTSVWSDQMYEQLRRTRDDGPTDILEHVAAEERDHVRELLRAAIDAHAPFLVDIRLAFPDEERWIHLRGRAFYDDAGAAVRLLGTSEDITERVRLDRQRAALEAQEARALEFQRAFIDVLSHELRTPMTTIYAAAEMLRRPHSSLTEADRSELLTDIHDETRRLDGLIENLLVLSRSERSAIEAVADPVDLRRLIEAVVRVESARWPTVSFSVELPDQLPLASGSDGYVSRILANLVSNAGKYAGPRGAVRIVVETTPDEVLVRVRDDGIGIDVDPERLFELFYRAPTAARHAAGSGIGLFVCARLVEAMDGRIWAAALEQGAEFGFALGRFDEVGAPMSVGPEGVGARVAAG